MTAGGALSITYSNFNYSALQIFQSGAGFTTPNLAAWNKTFEIAAGTYTLYIHYSSSSAQGIYQFTIDSNIIGTLDLYNAAAAPRTASIANVVIGTSGLHTFYGNNIGKNASSSNYAGSFYKFVLR